jgi:hypothetical protein
VKCNQHDLITGLQITDPTVITMYTNQKGGGSGSQPVSTTYRISIDNSTRNANARGGFFPPRTRYNVQPDGRIAAETAQAMVTSAALLMTNLELLEGGLTEVGVYSKADATVYTANRLRVGDVPDNIRRRRNRLRETYIQASI